jgi:predicted nucleotidyltransferase
MKREDVFDILKKNELELQSYGVERLAIFGSVARNEAGPDSDVDILVEFIKPTGLFGLIELRLYLEKTLGTSVDIGTVDCLKEEMQQEVLRECVYVS